MGGDLNPLRLPRIGEGPAAAEGGGMAGLGLLQETEWDVVVHLLKVVFFVLLQRVHLSGRVRGDIDGCHALEVRVELVFEIIARLSTICLFD